jgi:hypothetical protein
MTPSTVLRGNQFSTLESFGIKAKRLCMKCQKVALFVFSNEQLETSQVYMATYVLYLNTTLAGAWGR